MNKIVRLSSIALAFLTYANQNITMEAPDQPTATSVSFCNNTHFNPLVLTVRNRSGQLLLEQNISARQWATLPALTSADFPLAITTRSQTINLSQDQILHFDALLINAQRTLPARFNGSVNFGIFLYPHNIQVHAEIQAPAPIKAVNTPQQKTEQKDCLICFEKQDSNQFCKFVCGHEFCKTCVQTIVNQSLREQQSQTLRCPNPDCHKELQDSDLAQLTLDQATKARLNEVKLQEWISKQPDAKHCPTPDCKFAFINDVNQKQTIKCPGCHQDFCTNCLLNHKETISCQKAKDLHLATDKNAADKASQEWKKVNTKECPRCHAAIQKNGGCNHIMCKQCHKHFCWLCLGDFDGMCLNRCPLYGGQAQAHAPAQHEDINIEPFILFEPLNFAPAANNQFFAQHQMIVNGEIVVDEVMHEEQELLRLFQETIKGFHHLTFGELTQINRILYLQARVRNNLVYDLLRHYYRISNDVATVYGQLQRLDANGIRPIHFAFLTRARTQLQQLTRETNALLQLIRNNGL